MRYYIYDTDTCQVMKDTSYYPSMDIHMISDHRWEGRGYLPDWAREIEDIDEHGYTIASAPKFIPVSLAISLDVRRRAFNRFLSSHHFGHDGQGRKISLSNWKSLILSWMFLLGLVGAVIWMFATAGIAHGIVCGIIAAIAFGCACRM